MDVIQQIQKYGSNLYNINEFVSNNLKLIRINKSHESDEIGNYTLLEKYYTNIKESKLNMNYDIIPEEHNEYDIKKRTEYIAEHVKEYLKI